MHNQFKLVGLAEVATMAGVAKQVIANWRVRHPDFPAPVSELRSGPVWLFEEVMAWAKERGITLKAILEKSDEDKERRETMAITVALVNMKGGVGKSTLTANLAWYCAYRGDKKVLLVDLDPQFNLSQYVMGTVDYENHLNSGKPTVIDIFEEFTPPILSGKSNKLNHHDAIANVQTWQDGSRIDVVPSRLELAWTLKNPTEKEELLRDFLDEVKEEYDLVLIDCAPTESMLTTAAYLASDHVLVPVKPEFLSTIGLPLLARSLKDFQAKHKKAKTPDIAGIVFNNASNSVEHDRSRSHVKKIANQHGWHVFKNEVGYSGSYPSGARAGKPIFLTDYARSWKKAEFERFADEFVMRIGL